MYQSHGTVQTPKIIFHAMVSDSSQMEGFFKRLERVAKTIQVPLLSHIWRLMFDKYVGVGGLFRYFPHRLSIYFISMICFT